MQAVQTRDDERKSLLSLRDFRHYFTGQVVSVFGNTLFAVGLSFAVLDATNSSSAVGYALGSAELARVAFLLIAGALADRFARRHLMIGSDLICFVSLSVLGVAFFERHASLATIVLLMAVYGAGSALFAPAAAGLMPAIVPKEQLKRANGVLSSGRNVGNIAGPACAGILVSTVGASVAVLVDAGTFLVSALALLTMRAGSTGFARKSKVISDIRAGLSDFLAQRWLVAIDVYSAFFNIFCYAPLVVLGPMIARTSLGGAVSWAIIVTSLSVGSLVGSLVAAKTTIGRDLRQAALALLVCAAPLLLLAVRAPAWAIAVATFAMGIVLSVFNISSLTKLQELVPAESVSRVSSYDSWSNLIVQPFAFAVVGPLAVKFGTQALLVVGGAWVLLTTVVLASRKELRFAKSGEESMSPAT